ncbi:MAG: GtrA family protein [Leifsonia xyli]|nr:MAG: GtrA family protein [Leifsonia xyli]
MPESRLRSLVHDLARFSVVGGIGFVVDVALFNLLRATVLPDGRITGAVLVAKGIAVTAAILTNWAGNRWWTFRERRRARAVSEAVGFFLISLAGSAIALGCLGVSHYLLGFRTALADNISTNLVGLALGSAFRFVAVRSWLFRGDPVLLGAEA